MKCECICRKDSAAFGSKFGIAPAATIFMRADVKGKAPDILDWDPVIRSMTNMSTEPTKFGAEFQSWQLSGVSPKKKWIENVPSSASTLVRTLATHSV